MTTVWTEVYETVQEFQINEKRLKAIVEVTVADDDCAIDIDFESDEHEREYLARFERGELVCVIIQVVARWNGIEGTDYLGACHVHPGGEREIKQIVEDHGMVEQAVESLKSEVFTRLEQLKQLVNT